MLTDDDFEDIVVSLNTISVALQGSGYGDRLLCAVFAFEEKGEPLYFIAISDVDQRWLAARRYSLE